MLGPNGAGKSTLLKAISRAQASTGTLEFRGESLQGMPAHAVVGKGICHCPEGRRLFPELTVLKNLLLGAYLRRDDAAVSADLKLVYSLFPILEQRAAQIVGTLSGGQQQMVAIGRALMGKPALLLLDEPSVGIAHRLKIEIFDAIKRIQQGGTAILMAEQDGQSALRRCRPRLCAPARPCRPRGHGCRAQFRRLHSTSQSRGRLILPQPSPVSPPRAAEALTQRSSPASPTPRRRASRCTIHGRESCAATRPSPRGRARTDRRVPTRAPPTPANADWKAPAGRA